MITDHKHSLAYGIDRNLKIRYSVPLDSLTVTEAQYLIERIETFHSSWWYTMALHDGIPVKP